MLGCDSAYGIIIIIYIILNHNELSVNKHPGLNSTFNTPIISYPWKLIVFVIAEASSEAYVFWIENKFEYLTHCNHYIRC